MKITRTPSDFSRTPGSTCTVYPRLGTAALNALKTFLRWESKTGITKRSEKGKVIASYKRFFDMLLKSKNSYNPK